MPRSAGAIAACAWLLALSVFASAPADAQALYERFIHAVTVDQSDEVAALLA